MVTMPVFCSAVASAALVDVPPPPWPGSTPPPELPELLPEPLLGLSGTRAAVEPEPDVVRVASPMAMPPTRAAAVRAAIPAPRRHRRFADRAGAAGGG